MYHRRTLTVLASERRFGKTASTSSTHPAACSNPNVADPSAALMELFLPDNDLYSYTIDGERVPEEEVEFNNAFTETFIRHKEDMKKILKIRLNSLRTALTLVEAGVCPQLSSHDGRTAEEKRLLRKYIKDLGLMEQERLTMTSINEEAAKIFDHIRRVETVSPELQTIKGLYHRAHNHQCATVQALRWTDLLDRSHPHMFHLGYGEQMGLQSIRDRIEKAINLALQYQ